MILFAHHVAVELLGREFSPARRRAARLHVRGARLRAGDLGLRDLDAARRPASPAARPGTGSESPAVAARRSSTDRCAYAWAVADDPRRPDRRGPDARHRGPGPAPAGGPGVPRRVRALVPGADGRQASAMTLGHVDHRPRPACLDVLPRPRAGPRPPGRALGGRSSPRTSLPASWPGSAGGHYYLDNGSSATPAAVAARTTGETDRSRNSYPGCRTMHPDATPTARRAALHGQRVRPRRRDRHVRRPDRPVRPGGGPDRDWRRSRRRIIVTAGLAEIAAGLDRDGPGRLPRRAERRRALRERARPRASARSSRSPTSSATRSPTCSATTA